MRIKKQLTEFNTTLMRFLFAPFSYIAIEMTDFSLPFCCLPVKNVYIIERYLLI